MSLFEDAVDAILLRRAEQKATDSTPTIEAALWDLGIDVSDAETSVLLLDVLLEATAPSINMVEVAGDAFLFGLEVGRRMARAEVLDESV